MKVSIKLEVTEDTLRRIRAGEGRFGKATRAEFKTWLDRVMTKATAALPTPKVRGGSTAPTSAAETEDLANDDAPAPDDDTAPAPKASTFQSKFAAAADAADDVICRHCGERKERHGKMGFTCPPVQGKPKGRMFEAVEAAAS